MIISSNESWSIFPFGWWRIDGSVLKSQQVSATLRREFLHFHHSWPLWLQSPKVSTTFLAAQITAPRTAGGLALWGPEFILVGSYQGHQDDNVNKVFGCFWGTQNWPYRFLGKYKSQFVLNRILQRRRQLKAKKIYIKINKTLALFQ